MPVIYLRKDLYDEIIKRGFEVVSFVNKIIEEKLYVEKKKEPEPEKVKKKTKIKHQVGGE